MKKFFLLLTILVFLFGCNPIQHMRNFNRLSDGDTIPKKYIVFIKDSKIKPLIDTMNTDSIEPNRLITLNSKSRQRETSAGSVRMLLKSKGIKGSKIKEVYVDIIAGAIVKMNSNKARKLAKDSDIEFVIPDVISQINEIQQTDPDDCINPIQQWLSPVIPTDQINPIQQTDSIQNRYDIDTKKHWTKALITAGGPKDGSGKTQVIWFLDTGVDPIRSEYLNVYTTIAKSFIGNSWTDDNGHGTFCAGVAAGILIPGNDTLDEIHYGVSEGASVVPVKVLDKDGKGSWGTVIAGLDYVAQICKKGDVVNLSLGAYDPYNFRCRFPALNNAIEKISKKNVFVTLSAGNDAGKAECNRPGCINATNIFTASSINADSTFAVYANFGTPIDYVTVGTRVFSLWNNGRYLMASGTSISSALLAGIIHANGGAPSPGSKINYMGMDYIIGIRR